MRDQEYKSRDKKVHKMTRDGLTEKNLTQGTEQRISQRLSDVSFDHVRSQEQIAGHRAAARGHPKQPQIKQGAKPADFYHQEETEINSGDRFADRMAPEVWAPSNAPASMRDAIDKPLLKNSPSNDDNTPLIKQNRRKKQRPSSRKEKGIKKSDTLNRIDAPDTTDVSDELESEIPEDGRLQFGTKDTPIQKPKQTGKLKQQNKKAPEHAPDAEHKQPEHSDNPKLRQSERSRLTFHEDIPENPTPKENAQGNKYRRKSNLYHTRCPPLKLEKVEAGDFSVPNKPASSRLQFEDGEKAPPEKSSNQKTAKKRKKQKSVKYVEDTKPQESTRLRYERSEIPIEDRKTNSSSKDTESATTLTKDSGKSRPECKLEKAKRHVQTADTKLEKAQSKLPTRYRVRLEKQYDNELGKTKHRLQFEAELIPENEKAPLIKRVGKNVVRTVKSAAVLKGHQKIREAERQNVAVEAVHKTEFATERAVGKLFRWNRQRLRTKPYREVRRAERQVTKANVNLTYQQLLKDHPELQKKALAKWIQKQKIKRKYAQAAREAEKTIHHTQQILHATGQIIRAVAQVVVANKVVIGTVALLALVVVMFSAGLASCTAMLSSIQSSYISSCYVADEPEIENSELYYTEMETDLQKDIDDTEINYPGYDEYQYNIGEIGHNPYELMGYLSAVYDAFTFDEVKAEIERLFGLQYQLVREEIIEIRTETDEDGNEREYEWRILKTTLTVTPLAEIIEANLPPGEQTDRYRVYMETYGNRQAYGNPFDFAWLGYITSPYGYRIHPITGEKNLHRGVDIGAAMGTPIKSVHDGHVISAGDAGDYGLSIVIEDEKGYQSRYAHCSSLSVTVGQEVKRGDIIAAVGSTGVSTGPHLHLEIKHNGEYLNPYYFVDNGGDGFTPSGIAMSSPAIPDKFEEPLRNGSFEAMLAEAEKYLGYPYVWGGSSPSTSFDCSGYVSWVINNSGVGNVGRLGAQGLFNVCTPVSKKHAQPGDLIFFTGTYSSPYPVSHVGIYVGGDYMIHCGDPISYANISSKYWQSHFYAFGRLPRVRD